MRQASGPINSSEDIMNDPDTDETSERVARIVRHAMARAPKETSAAILSELNQLDRVHLVLALQAAVDREAIQRRGTAWVEDNIRHIGSGHPSSGGAAHTLTRRAVQKDLGWEGSWEGTAQIASALEYQRVLSKFSMSGDSMPGRRQLLAVALASGLPFVGFGIIDNSIMIMAGEQIDTLLGVRLGITTLASAALGNLVADVVGVGVTHQIQSNAKRIKWAAPPRLSTLQQNLPRVRYAKFAGAVLGVSLGCIVGMAPLAFMETGFFEKAPPKAPEGSAAAADLMSA
ncbi:Transmembrane protein 65 [Auxenochlorella protothecoides]|uniref:Transmembrane protein 65 n=1 Tax=Auxenochlorella protothecoides TaxID=3075 RepID=A0A087SJY7_AUXPR|nr:Transmembrane protein 65 [Auxenochlorella protothecoides]KFM26041.1 Transmembrane protein 65 [Auxenochlorella protothecoides]